MRRFWAVATIALAAAGVAVLVAAGVVAIRSVFPTSWILL